MTVSPPYNISTSTPASGDNINLWPGQAHPMFDTIESWLLAISDTSGNIKSTALPNPLVPTSTSSGVSTGPVIGVSRRRASPADGDLNGRVIFYANNDAGTEIEMADLIQITNDVTNGTEDATLRFRRMVAGALTTAFNVDASGTDFFGDVTVENSFTAGSATFSGTLGVSGALTSGAHAVTGNLSATGNVSFGGNLAVTGTVTAASDRRLKTDIVPLRDSLARINALQGVCYKMAATGVTNIGLVAQDVAEVIPEVVFEDENGLLSIAYGNLVAELVEAVKELTARVAELEARG